ncbi:hypothetical protein LTR56_003461 [Elasticomyces elasticus]|nr:hypothetical protein LTR22_010937 [Elasticomyces elasticus]KAK3655455.1 hypothetical protein LTR56_003461 [Elasticomyces elasticus]KAK4919908.1 hypothetical protein LTR49_012506 [Elasticomyces elasticus]
MASNEHRHLIRVLDERNIPLDPDDVAKAFANYKTRPAITSWVQEYLSPATLLTKEELHFHDTHANTSNGLASQNAVGRPLSDSDFETATASLETSTAAIEQQCRLMESQKQALTELKARNTTQTNNTAGRDRQKKLARDKAQLEFEVDELADVLESSSKASAQQADAAVSGMPHSVNRVLEKDDRLLDGLQKLLPKLAEREADQDVGGEVDRLCQLLAALSAQEIRLRLDRAYETCAGAASSTANGHTNESRRQQQSLKDELAELSSEIDGLATMAVDGQYRVPIMRDLQSTTSNSDSDQARWSEYVATTLQYLTSRLTALEQHYQHLHSHQGALSQLTNAIDEACMASSPTPQTTQQAPPRSPATPSSVKGLKPLRLVQANFSEPQDPVTQLLRSFDIRVADTSDTSKLIAVLEQASRDRRTRLAQLRESTECSMSDQLGETFVKADESVQDLLTALYAHSPYGTVRLADAQTETGKSRLETRIQDLGEEMRGLDIDIIAGKVREQQRQILGQN